MPTLFYCIKLNQCNCKGSWFVSMKQNMNFIFQLVGKDARMLGLKSWWATAMNRE
jgi:hypothetical protein